jgi:tetratricopeptide (TPR) repeat protein
VSAGRCLSYRAIVETYFHESGKLDRDSPFETQRRGLALLEGTDDAWGKALAASQIGAHTRRAGDWEGAHVLLERAVELARATGERYLLGSCLPKLGNLYMDRGNYAAAEPLFREALAAFREIREYWWTGRCIQYLAQTAAGQGNQFLAALLLGSSDAVMTSGGARRNPREEREYQDLTKTLRQTIGEERFADTYDRGHQMSLESLLALLFDVPLGTGAR